VPPQEQKYVKRLGMRKTSEGE